ncbi:MAG: nucleotidyltransferase domain-containing protein [Sphingomonas sp.]|uniref:nucleotidyltransferase family protein n=1 Tax=Sphingomonas sp. TaxID=28214 RepID=UPI003563F741
MKYEAILDQLRKREKDIRAMGLEHLSLFGSTARGDGNSASDVDLAATFDDAARIDLFRFAEIAEQLSEMLGATVDLVAEPARTARMQAEIDRDRVRVF